jgi:hypothetical protein
MNTEKVILPATLPIAAVLWKLPRDRRDALLEAAAAIARDLYRHVRSLTNFEAFGPDDLHGESTAAPKG